MKRSSIASAAVAMVMAAAQLYAQGDRPGQAGKQGNQTPPAHHDVEVGARGFITDMAMAGMAEVQLGKMASERGSDAGVKAFGQMMVTDHTRAGDELKQVASQLNVTLPAQLDQKHRDLADRLSKLQGAAFDRAYIDAMVQGHQEVAAKLGSRAGNRSTSAEGTRPGVSGTAPGSAGAQAGDKRPNTAGSQAGPQSTVSAQGEQALNQWATKTLPTVQQHLERARDLQQKMGK